MEECLICKEALLYLPEAAQMECAICHRSEPSKTRCINGHYVCNECHTQQLDSIFDLCRKESSRDPIVILEKMMAMPFCHMHGPEHHVMVGAALLTAYKNAGGKVDFESALAEMYQRGKEVPGGVCGFWGACGAGISTGQFVSIVTGSSPLSEAPWSLSNSMTAFALDRIAQYGGPRCCKRDSYLAIMAAVDFAADRLHIQMDRSPIHCTRSSQNRQCIAARCPFFGVNL